MIAGVWKHGFPCVFHSITGLYCPGCGMTRAVKSLLGGRILDSLRYNPVAFYVAAVVLVELAGYLLAKKLHKPGLHIRHYEMFLYIGIAVMLVNWGIKDYYLIFRGIDLLQF